MVNVLINYDLSSGYKKKKMLKGQECQSTKKLEAPFETLEEMVNDETISFLMDLVNLGRKDIYIKQENKGKDKTLVMDFSVVRHSFDVEFQDIPIDASNIDNVEEVVNDSLKFRYSVGYQFDNEVEFETAVKHFINLKQSEKVAVRQYEAKKEQIQGAKLKEAENFKESTAYKTSLRKKAIYNKIDSTKYKILENLPNIVAYVFITYVAFRIAISGVLMTYWGWGIFHRILVAGIDYVVILVSMFSVKEQFDEVGEMVMFAFLATFILAILQFVSGIYSWF